MELQDWNSPIRWAAESMRLRSHGGVFAEGCDLIVESGSVDLGGVCRQSVHAVFSAPSSMEITLVSCCNTNALKS